MKRWQKIVLGNVVVLVSVLALAGCGGEMSEEDRAQGKHCFDMVDTNESFYTKVYAQLADPGSLREELTVIGPVIDGEHRIKMDFTAKNALGQTIRGNAVGWVDTETCNAVLENIT